MPKSLSWRASPCIDAVFAGQGLFISVTMIRFVGASLLAMLLAACSSLGPAPVQDTGFRQLYAAINGSLRGIDKHYPRLLADYQSSTDFACRYPAYARHFRQSGRVSPPSDSSVVCTAPLPLLMADPERGLVLANLDVERVSAVHLLFAGKADDSLVSRFGHVALRVLVCPQGVMPANDPEKRCDANLSEHLVLGFQAYVDDTRISITRGIFGGYQTHLMVMPFMETYQQYAVAEFRELHSLPLLMSRQQRQDFLRAMVQLHWSHESDYRFFTRNCATLLQDALRALWPAYEEPPALHGNYQRPDHFFRAISHSDIADAAVLADRPAALRDGYYFSSTEAAYRQAATLLAAAMEYPFFTSLDDYLGQPPDLRRQLIDADAGLRAQWADNARLREVPLLLEELVLVRAEKQVMQSGVSLWEKSRKLLQSPGRLGLAEDDDAFLQACFIQPLRAQLQPPPRQAAIPREAFPVADLAPACSTDEERQRLKQLVQRLAEAQPAEWSQLLASVTLLGDSIRNVNHFKHRALAGVH